MFLVLVLIRAKVENLTAHKTKGRKRCQNFLLREISTSTRNVNNNI